MENKQTAVDYLFNELIANPGNFIKAYKQAKEMEKEQIIDAFGVGCQVESTRLIGYQDIADDYYNETFKSE